MPACTNSVELVLHWKQAQLPIAGRRRALVPMLGAQYAILAEMLQLIAILTSS
jgi:hypothetical protein